MGMGWTGNSPHGNPMGISQKWEWDGRECELNRWEWERTGMLKAIPAHLYNAVHSCSVLELYSLLRRTDCKVSNNLNRPRNNTTAKSYYKT